MQKSLNKLSAKKILLLLGPKSEKVDNLFCPVIRIHLILMRIRILDPHWKKMDPGHEPFFQVYWIVKIFFFFFPLKLDEPFRDQEIFIISLCSLDPDSWIRIFLRIRIQEAKILRIWNPDPKLWFCQIYFYFSNPTSKFKRDKVDNLFCQIYSSNPTSRFKRERKLTTCFVKSTSPILLLGLRERKLTTCSVKSL